MAQAAYIVTCEKCGAKKRVEADDLARAKFVARGIGWGVSWRKCLCPACVKVTG